MNLLKIQQEILKALLSEKTPVSYCYCRDDLILVITNPAVGYLMPEDKLLVDLSGAQRSLLNHCLERVDQTLRPENRLIGTDEYRRGGTARKYVRSDNEEAAVYFDTGLLKNFEHPDLYQEAGEEKRFAIVTEKGVGDDERKVVGIVCPVKINA